MGTDDISFSVPAVWSVFYNELHGTAWDEDDIDAAVYRKNHDAAYAARALKVVHDMEWKGVEAEDGVLATLKAAQEFHGGTYLTPGQVKEMARHFAVHYRDIVEPMDDYLEENCGEVRWHWLNDHGRREIEKAVVKDSKIWIEDVNVSDDVWVFNKPSRT